MSPVRSKQGTKCAIDAAIHFALDQYKICLPALSAFQELLNCARSRSRLLSPETFRGCNHQRIIQGLLRMFWYRRHWQQSLWEWYAPQGSIFVQFRALANHLFAAYPIPNFMTSVWLMDAAPDLHWHLRLFVHLGLGKSIRQFDTPIRLTKAMARHTMQAPDDLSVVQALRWGQVLGLGGDKKFARTVLKTVLRSPTSNEPFWEQVIQMMARNAPISSEEVMQLVGFIHQQRFQPARLVLRWGNEEMPLQPDFDIRGQTLRSLRRHMANWQEERRIRLQREYERNQRLYVSQWARTDIQPFRHAENGRYWTIEELLSDMELRTEGGIMQHCVASYIHRCAHRQSSIWSMKLHEGQRQQRILTIEVDPKTRQIRQAKGRRNTAPDGKSMHILRQWALKAGLSLE